MLNPIDTEAVIRDGGAVGVFPGQIHEGVAWWVGACFVVTRGLRRLAVAHDGHPTALAFASRLCSGAINAQHYACAVHHLGGRSRNILLGHTEDSAGAWVSASDSDTTTVKIELFQKGGALLEESPLTEIRRLIAEDRVPLPVNMAAKGRILHDDVTEVGRS